jgi:Family of unknown function (DUF6941)
MDDPFTVDFAVLCDYAAIERTGKHILGGVYGAEINFSSEPPTWPPMWLFVALQPIARKFDFEIRLVRPDDRLLIAFTGSYESSENPSATARLTVPIQLAYVRFTGAGMYRIQVSETGKQPTFKRSIEVRVGEPTSAAATLRGTVLFDIEP